MTKVHYNRFGCVTARLLRSELEKRGYTGLPINWGKSWTDTTEVLNKPSAVKLASHKHQALQALTKSGIPTLLVPTRLVYKRDLPVVGRKSYHSAGSDFYLCLELYQVKEARKAGATHFQHFLEDCREFRVHIINGKSVRVSERYGNKRVTDNLHHGGKFRYPREFKKLPQLRSVARDAVEALGLDFGAVDILYNGDFFVLEVNSAPSLVTCWSHILPSYVEAFMTL